MPPLRNLPLPFGEPISKRDRPGYKPGTDPQAGLMTRTWIDSLTAVNNQLNSMPVKSNAVVLTDQSASISATDMTEGSINGGQYRLSWWYGVTTPAAASSELQVDFDWQYRGVTRTESRPNLVGNTTAEYDTSMIFIPVDGNTPVRYTVTYLTGLGAPMEYDIQICLEQVPL